MKITVEDARRKIGRHSATHITIRDAVKITGRHENTWYYRIRVNLIDPPSGMPHTSRRTWEINYFVNWVNANE